MGGFWDYFLTPTLSFLTNFFTEIMIAQLLFTTALEKRKYYYVALAGWLAANLGFFLIPGFYSTSGFLTFGGWFNLSFFLALIVSSVFFYSTVKINFKEVLFYSSASYAIQNLIHNLSLYIIDKAGLTYRVGWGLVIEIAVIAVLFTGFYFLFVSRIKRGEQTAIENGYLIIVSVLTILVTYVLSMLLLPTSTSNDVALLYASICCLFLLFMQFSIFDKGRVQQEKETVEQLYHSEQKQYDQWKANVDIINVKCHDLKHQINSLRKMDNLEEKDKSLKDIEKAMMLYDCVAKTGNETLDVLTTEKAMLCEQNNIKLSYIVDASNLNMMTDMDICSLFGNALDNAIEGVKRIPDQEKRIISLRITSKGEMLLIHIDNYCDGKVVIKNSLPITSKADKNYHGFGMKSMRMIVEKYRGEMVASIKNQIFNLDILLPIDKQK